MDPNETLARLRALLGGDSSTFTFLDGSLNDVMHRAQELINKLYEAEVNFQALDEWLSKGGFLPDDWERKEGDNR